MTMQNVIAFGTAVENNKAMQGELAAAVDGKQGKEALTATAEFAAAKGYDVTPEEVATVLDALAKMQNGKTEELSDQELEIVSGGKQSAQQAFSSMGSALDSAGSWINSTFGTSGSGAFSTAQNGGLNAQSWKDLFHIK